MSGVPGVSTWSIASSVADLSAFRRVRETPDGNCTVGAEECERPALDGGWGCAEHTEQLEARAAAFDAADDRAA